MVRYCRPSLLKDFIKLDLGTLFALAFFLLPETIFDRPTEAATDEDLIEQIIKSAETGTQYKGAPITGVPYIPPPMDLKTYLRKLWFWDLDRPESRRLKATDFVIKPLSMLKYPSVTFPALYK